MDSLTCPKCQGAMEAGFLLDKSHGEGYANATEWAEGEPERSIWTGLKLRGRERHPDTTFRCERCGFLESYAHANKPHGRNAAT